MNKGVVCLWLLSLHGEKALQVVFKRPTELTVKQNLHFCQFCTTLFFFFPFSVSPLSYKNMSRLVNCSLNIMNVINNLSNPIFRGCCLYLPCALAQSDIPPLQEQQREVSTDQLQRDWPTLCQQTSEDERNWSVVSTRVRTAPTHCSHAVSLSHAHKHRFDFNE